MIPEKYFAMPNAAPEDPRLDSSLTRPDRSLPPLVLCGGLFFPTGADRKALRAARPTVPQFALVEAPSAFYS
jgi:hypothetical protein